LKEVFKLYFLDANLSQKDCSFEYSTLLSTISHFILVIEIDFWRFIW